MRALSFILLCFVGLVAGCATNPESVSTPLDPSEIYESEGWQANTTTILALDIRADGVLDFEWPKDVPVEIREKLSQRAYALNQSWDGE